MLGKRDLYRSVNSPNTSDDSTDNVRNDEREFLNQILTVLSYSDGNESMVEIANRRLECGIRDLIPVVNVLEEEDLLKSAEGQ